MGGSPCLSSWWGRCRSSFLPVYMSVSGATAGAGAVGSRCA